MEQETLNTGTKLIQVNIPLDGCGNACFMLHILLGFLKDERAEPSEVTMKEPT